MVRSRGVGLGDREVYEFDSRLGRSLLSSPTHFPLFFFRVVGSVVLSPSGETKNCDPVWYRCTHVKDPTATTRRHVLAKCCGHSSNFLGCSALRQPAFPGGKSTRIFQFSLGQYSTHNTPQIIIGVNVTFWSSRTGK